MTEAELTQEQIEVVEGRALTLTQAEQLELAERGPEKWNAYRDENPDFVPDFIGMDLRGFNFSGFDLSSANFYDADLRDADLSRANLSGASLSGANLSRADLSEANLREANLEGAIGLRETNIPLLRQCYEQIKNHPETHDQEVWHSDCGTKHCLAGWAVTLAGEAGSRLEQAHGTQEAARQLLGDLPATWFGPDCDVVAEMEEFFNSLEAQG